MYKPSDRPPSVVPVMVQPAQYMPDELLLEILEYIEGWKTLDRQKTLARFCGVNRQWYDVAIPKLYDSPYLVGSAYSCFIRTICPSVNAHIKLTSLSSLVRILDLSHIVHQGNKSTTARLLGRTKNSLEVFIAPQASFAINCWASLSKCSKLRTLDLSLVSECISYQSLNQTVRQLGNLRKLYLPRCSSSYDSADQSINILWPPRLQHLSLSGSIHGRFLWEMLQQPDHFPPTLSSMSILHCPGLDLHGVKSLLQNLRVTLTTVELRDLPNIKQGRFNGVLDWLPNITTLTIALDYIDMRFAHMPFDFNPSRWGESKPLQTFSLVTSGQRDTDPSRAFTPNDLFTLIDDRFFGRLRSVNVACSTGWWGKEEGAQVEAVESLMVEEVDRENWENRRWHFEGLSGVPEGMTYDLWLNTRRGREMRPRVRMIRDL